MFARGASSSAVFRTVLGGGRVEDRDSEILLCGLSALEMDEFLDDKRLHMAEGIVVEQVRLIVVDCINPVPGL
jgi:hypothetical protein